MHIRLSNGKSCTRDVALNLSGCSYHHIVIIVLLLYFLSPLAKERERTSATNNNGGKRGNCKNLVKKAAHRKSRENSFPFSFPRLSFSLRSYILRIGKTGLFVWTSRNVLTDGSTKKRGPAKKRTSLTPTTLTERYSSFGEGDYLGAKLLLSSTSYFFRSLQTFSPLSSPKLFHKKRLLFLGVNAHTHASSIGWLSKENACIFQRKALFMHFFLFMWRTLSVEILCLYMLFVCACVANMCMKYNKIFLPQKCASADPESTGKLTH